MLGIILACLNALTLAKFYNPDSPKDMIATVRAKIAETTLRAWFYFFVTSLCSISGIFSGLCRRHRRLAGGGS